MSDTSMKQTTKQFIIFSHDLLKSWLINDRSELLSVGAVLLSELGIVVIVGIFPLIIIGQGREEHLYHHLAAQHSPKWGGEWSLRAGTSACGHVVVLVSGLSSVDKCPHYQPQAWLQCLYQTCRNLQNIHFDKLKNQVDNDDGEVFFNFWNLLWLLSY